MLIVLQRVYQKYLDDLQSRNAFQSSKYIQAFEKKWAFPTFQLPEIAELRDKLGMNDQSTHKRPKPKTIQTVKSTAPWMLVSEASEQSHLTVKMIRASGLELRPFGNADYVRPKDLNH